MKKSLLILSLFFVAQGAFSSNNAGYSLKIAAENVIQEEVNDLPATFLIDLNNGYTLTGTSLNFGNHYTYIGFLSHNGEIVGSVSGSYDTETLDGVEAMIDESANETYSNDEVSEVMNAKRGAVKNAIQNVR